MLLVPASFTSFRLKGCVLIFFVKALSCGANNLGHFLSMSSGMMRLKGAETAESAKLR
jgi:hypothetical protein